MARMLCANEHLRLLRLNRTALLVNAQRFSVQGLGRMTDHFQPGTLMPQVRLSGNQSGEV